ncbi:unnamed protein product [marine sediment metagenome]|uniref:HK97 gp10 family phage protein n=1 Tax=marine sediment metagenome TaxID=412755 RepID=X1U653_9ZZZZ
MKIEEFEERFVELFAFEIAQEISKEAPKDTGLLAKSFAPTVTVVKGNIITWRPPFYWKFVEFGTIKQRPNPFIRRTLEKETDRVAVRVIEKLSKQ